MGIGYTFREYRKKNIFGPVYLELAVQSSLRDEVVMGETLHSFMVELCKFEAVGHSNVIVIHDDTRPGESRYTFRPQFSS